MKKHFSFALCVIMLLGHTFGCLAPVPAAISGKIKEKEALPEFRPTIKEDVYKLDYLLFKISFLYRSGGKGDFQNLNDGSILHSGDHYKILFTPTSDSYVYIFQIDSKQKLYQLFPMERFGGVTVNNFNPVLNEQTVYIPAKEKSFMLDANTGTEKIYFFASEQRDLELEKLYENYQREMQQSSRERQLEQLDLLLAHASKLQGGDLSDATYTESEAEDTISWEEDQQSFSVLQQRLDNMCNGCVYILTFEHR